MWMSALGIVCELFAEYDKVIMWSFLLIPLLAWYFNYYVSLTFCPLVFQLQYVSKASSTLRAALKEPAKSKAMAQETFSYNKAIWSEGTMGTKTLVDGLKSVGK